MELIAIALILLALKIVHKVLFDRPTKGVVAYTIDGDSLQIQTEKGQSLEVRVRGLDAPEIPQPGGIEAKLLISRLTSGETLKLSKLRRDKFGRTVATVWVGGQNLARLMIEAGAAWADPQEKIYVSQERKARRQKVGIWADARPIAPWDYRKAHPYLG